jgi:hypothetical protein
MQNDQGTPVGSNYLVPRPAINLRTHTPLAMNEESTGTMSTKITKITPEPILCSHQPNIMKTV